VTTTGWRASIIQRMFLSVALLALGIQHHPSPLSIFTATTTTTVTTAEASLSSLFFWRSNAQEVEEIIPDDESILPSTPAYCSDSSSIKTGSSGSAGGAHGSNLSHTASLLAAAALAPDSQQQQTIAGRIHDVAGDCHMQDLEQANDSQLYEILQELKRTAFFREFAVDLDHTCPLTAKNEKKNGSDAATDLENEEEEEFQCGSGGGSDHSNPFEEDGEDDGAEPLCTVQGGGGGSSSSGYPFASNALQTLHATGFQSQSQHDAFAWKDVTDAVFTEVRERDRRGTITEDDLLPDSFWTDMCSYIGVGESVKTINLALNPERNTGYNGTHIWRAIYEENCVTATASAAAGSPSALALGKENTEMCLEERVLYRLLSGLHTSTTLSIAMNYYPPSKKKKREHWEANPDYFMERFEGNPDHIRNLHFSYLVLLRALRKATPFLYQYNYDGSGDSYGSGNGSPASDDAAVARKLVQRLLDSSILQSCNFFSAFDESQLFAYGKEANEEPASVLALKQNFKGVFHNVSSILDCVQCQQCKLHGKLAMTGYGVALKVLFMQETPALERNEIVALINTIVKMSESVRHVRELTALYLQKHNLIKEAKTDDASVRRIASRIDAQPPGSSPDLLHGANAASSLDLQSVDLVDTTVGLVAALGRANRISTAREDELVRLALSRHPELLILAKHYATDAEKFVRLSAHIRPDGTAASLTVEPIPDAIVIGSGLAGLSCALNLLDRGGRVILIEKEHSLGGNSNKASSGINACCPNDHDNHDSLDVFRNDTIRSAGSSAREDLIDVLVTHSAEAVEWLRTRVGVDLSLISQLGGHSSMRTHRPSNGMAGAEIIYGISKAVKAYAKSGDVTIMTDTKVTKLITADDGSVIGVECASTKDHESDEHFQLHALNVVLATGGFAADRSSGSFLDRHRPELLNMPTTAGLFSTGDGISLATQLGAATVDMDKVQIHPTGWVDPGDPDNTSKVLAAELMRGVGGVLINDAGDRFCNELGTRAYVTDKMLSHNTGYAKTGNWSIDAPIPTFSLVLSSSAAEDGRKHVDLYTHKGLMMRLEGVSALAKWMGLPISKVTSTLRHYQEESKVGKDAFGKTTFRAVPSEDLENEVFYAGRVTPVLHYCMGGITIDKDGSVLNEEEEIIPGLHAAGEVSGGVHGTNRLAGNSLLECTVFGTRVGRKLPIFSRTSQPIPRSLATTNQKAEKPSADRVVSLVELQKHSTSDDCWVAIHGTVYDLTDFAEEHPAGAESIFALAGKDGTDAFSAVHNKGMLEEFDEEVIGIFGV
jgi:flavocytochrome c